MFERNDLLTFMCYTQVLVYILCGPPYFLSVISGHEMQ